MPNFANFFGVGVVGGTFSDSQRAHWLLHVAITITKSVIVPSHSVNGVALGKIVASYTKSIHFKRCSHSKIQLFRHISKNIKLSTTPYYTSKCW